MDPAKPHINVTPLIDVLLVLLIIFMIISPLEPSKFETKIPSEPKENNICCDGYILIVKVNSDSTLELNGSKNMGSIEEPEALQKKLSEVFAERAENGVVNENFQKVENPTDRQTIQRTVFVKAPKAISYGRVVKVIDVVKAAGAQPIGLQIDYLA